MAAASPNASSLESLRGGVAVITGGASGIGLAVAHEALQHGLHVAIGVIEQAALDAALPELRAAAAAGLGVEGYQCDVTDAASCDRFASSVASEASFGGASVSLLHCNAGVGAGGSVLEAKPGDWLFTFNVNVFGVANTLRSFVPAMVERGVPGAIVNTSSIAGVTVGGTGPYGASKHACTVLTESVYTELAEGAPHLSVHTLHPQIVDTNIDKSQRNKPSDLEATETDFLHMGGVGDALFHERGMQPSSVAAYAHTA